MSIATVQTRYCYGLKGNVANSVTYLDERNILYPSGANLVLCNAVQKTQKFVPLSPDTGGATALAVSPNKRYVAVAEKKGERPTITVFDLTTLKRKKVLSYAEGSFQEYVSLGFSPDSKSLVSQSGGPDWSMCLWQWEKAKVLAQIKSNGNTTYPIRQVSFLNTHTFVLLALGHCFHWQSITTMLHVYKYNELCIRLGRMHLCICSSVYPAVHKPSVG